MKVGNIGINAVTTEKIDDGTITAADLSANAVTLGALAEQLKQLLVPTGSVMPFAGDTAPAGWKLCNGASLSQAAYPELYAVISKRFGQGDSATTTFRVPDLRGRFIRGRNNGTSQVSVDGELRGRDPDASSRIAMNLGGATGDAVGSLQYDEFREHTHEMTNSISYLSEGNDTSGGYHDPVIAIRDSNATGGNETRPVNVYMNYIIKL